MNMIDILASSQVISLFDSEVFNDSSNRYIHSSVPAFWNNHLHPLTQFGAVRMFLARASGEFTAIVPPFVLDVSASVFTAAKVCAYCDSSDALSAIFVAPGLP